MPEQSEPEAARASGEQQELHAVPDEALQIATEIMNSLARSEAERERVRVEAMAADLETHAKASGVFGELLVKHSPTLHLSEP